MANKKVSFVAALTILLGATRVAAEPLTHSEIHDPHPGPPNACPVVPCHLRMREYTTVTKDNGQQFRFPPGRFLDESTWVLVDDEMRRLQDQETRLKAENKSLKHSISSEWKPGWLLLSSAILLSFAGGVATYYYFEHR